MVGRADLCPPQKTIFDGDRAVLAAYGLRPDTPEPEIVAHLFKLYAMMWPDGPQYDAISESKNKILLLHARIQ